VDAVYLMGAIRSDELRYSLRSLANLPMVDRVVIAGWMPPWVRGAVHVVPEPHRPGKHWDTWANLGAAARAAVVSDSFVLMNDDFFVTDATEHLPAYEAGPLVDDGGRRPDDERLSRRCTVASVLAGMGLVAPLGGWRSFELHVPMPVNRIALADVLDHADRVRPPECLPAGKRSLYGNAVGLAGPAMHDVKVRDMRTVPAEDAEFVSTTEFTFRSGAVGHWLRERLHRPSPWERA
jgi:hypothetical protein